MAWNTELPTARTYWQSKTNNMAAVRETTADSDQTSRVVLLTFTRHFTDRTVNSQSPSEVWAFLKESLLMGAAESLINSTTHIKCETSWAEVLPCVPALAASRQVDRPQSERRPSSHCWTWLSSCRDTFCSSLMDSNSESVGKWFVWLIWQDG